MTTYLASVDGAIAPSEESTISVTDDGLLRGDGAFEVVRLYGGQPFAMADHLTRLRHSCEGLRLEADVIALEREIDALLDEVGPLDALLRIVLTRGGRRIVIVEPMPTQPETAKVATVTFAPGRLLDTLKTLSYGGNMLAGRLAKERGADEALFVTPHGRVLEGATWTFFWAAGERLYTPPLSERILHSITRAHLLRVTDAEERITTLDDLATADEAFIASSVREVMPISAIDDRALPQAPGPVTAAAARAFREHVEHALGG
ncbi:MAG: branched-chain amino acid aminotransferase [Solirubrobacteraceae bacterium]|nr:branched-chain amino acid aminotransferase [Solirubrobacteraceae bacterium]